MDINDKEIFKLFYGPAATIRRINLGWSRRADKNQTGFMLDIDRGYWAKNEQDQEDDLNDPLSNRKERVIPYVDDRKNSLIIEPIIDMSVEEVASLQAALKNAIQLVYQLEDNELAAEPLPTRDIRKSILIYESAEGGAGVLKQLVDDKNALNKVIIKALDLCHFDPVSGEDLRRSEKAREDCEAACYDCLMSYTNQRDHKLLDRHIIRNLMLDLTGAIVKVSPGTLPRGEHLQHLLNLCQSGLESDWLMMLDSLDLKLPSDAQRLIEDCRTRPDFIYQKEQVAIYIDGPHHDFPDRHERDTLQTTCMEDYGYSVIRFGLKDDWQEIVNQFPGVFGGR